MGSATRLRYKTAATFKRTIISVQTENGSPFRGATEEEPIPYYHQAPSSPRQDDHQQSKHSHAQCLHCNKLLPLFFFASTNTRLWEFGLPNILWVLINNIFPGFFLHQRLVWLQIKQSNQHELKCTTLSCCNLSQKQRKILGCIFIQS